jgi:amphi-Trp domain-containing protein
MKGVAMNNSEIKLKNNLDRDRAVSYLQDIVNSLKAGTINVEQAEQSLSFEVPPAVAVEIKAKQKEDKESITLKMSWSRHPECCEAPADLKISAGAGN